MDNVEENELFHFDISAKSSQKYDLVEEKNFLSTLGYHTKTIKDHILETSQEWQEWADRNKSLAKSDMVGEYAHNIDIVTAYFTPAGWFEIKKAVMNPHVGRVRLLLGSDPFSFYKENFHDAEILSTDAASHQIEHSLNRTTLVDGYKMQAFYSWLRANEKVEIRTFIGDTVAPLPSRFLHAKTWHFYPANSQYQVKDPGTIIVGSANLTYSGMNSNIEAAIHIDDSETSQDSYTWFENLWSQSNDYKQRIMDLYEDRIENKPYEEVFHTIIARQLSSRKFDAHLSDLERETDTDWLEGLSTFQRQGALEVQARLDYYNGAIIADEVGLGKTYTAGAILKKAIKEKKQVLIVAPPSIHSTWKTYLENNGLGNRIGTGKIADAIAKLHDPELESLYYKHFIDIRTYGTTGKSDKETDLTISENKKRRQYDLVIFDEAHSLRNHTTQQYKNIAENLIPFLGNSRQLLFLTATPINNRLNDLLSLLNLFLLDDQMYSEAGVRSLKQKFRDAENNFSEQDWSWIHALLHKIMIKRTRKFIVSHYPELKHSPDWKFPKVAPPQHLSYEFTPQYKQLSREIIESVSPSAGASKLSLAVYKYSYARNQKMGERQRQFASGLFRTLLLQNLSSSPDALAFTLTNFKDKISARLNNIDSPTQVADDVLIMDEDVEEAEEGEDTVLNKTTPTFELPGWSLEEKEEHMQELQNDLELVERWLNQLTRMDRDKFNKNQEVIRLLTKISENASNKQCSTSCIEADCKQCQAVQNDARKVIIFCRYKTSVSSLAEELSEMTHVNLSYQKSYQNKIVTVDGSLKADEKTKRIHSFAPNTAAIPKEQDDLLPETNILITTDVLAEGVNLQQSSHVIHYDLPWNPMKLVQRMGRVNRLKSRHQEVYSYFIKPDDETFNLVLGVLRTLEAKMLLIQQVLKEENAITGQRDSVDIPTDLEEEIVDILLNGQMKDEEKVKAIDKRAQEKSLFGLGIALVKDNNLVYQQRVLAEKGDPEKVLLLDIDDIINYHEEWKKQNRSRKQLPLSTGAIIKSGDKKGWLLSIEEYAKKDRASQRIHTAWITHGSLEKQSWEAIFATKVTSWQQIKPWTLTANFSAELEAAFEKAKRELEKTPAIQHEGECLSEDFKLKLRATLTELSERLPGQLEDLEAKNIDILIESRYLLPGTRKKIERLYDNLCSSPRTELHFRRYINRMKSLTVPSANKIPVIDTDYRLVNWIRFE